VDVPFAGDEWGPTRVVSEEAANEVVDFVEAIQGDVKATRLGQIIEQHPNGSSTAVMVTPSYEGERMLGFYGGRSMGTVTQWLKPSHNSQVIRAGLRVRVVEEFLAYKFEFYSDGLIAFPDPMPAGMNGTVVFMMNGGKVVNSGSAVVIFDLPDSWEKSHNGGMSTGPLIVAAENFPFLEVLGASAPQVPAFPPIPVALGASPSWAD